MKYLKREIRGTFLLNISSVSLLGPRKKKKKKKASLSGRPTYHRRVRSPILK